MTADDLSAPLGQSKSRQRRRRVPAIVPRALVGVLALALLVFVSASVGHEFKLKEVLFLSVALVILSVLVFVRGLGLPFSVWPRFLG